MESDGIHLMLWLILLVSVNPIQGADSDGLEKSEQRLEHRLSGSFEQAALGPDPLPQTSWLRPNLSVFCLGMLGIWSGQLRLRHRLVTGTVYPARLCTAKRVSSLPFLWTCLAVASKVQAWRGE